MPKINIDSFLTGLACTESSGRFDAVNQVTGAFGKYQVMPRNWPVWAGRYLGNPWAPKSPRNQEFVVRQRIEQLHANHRTWRNVAHWWLTGNVHEDRTDWSPQATRYVRRVMGFARAAAAPHRFGRVPKRCHPLDISPPRVRTDPFLRLRIAGGAVHVREAPGAGNRVVAIAHRGQRVALLRLGLDAHAQRWVRVGLADGRSGWVASWYTERVEQGR
ncbi:MAG TPA: SH3 domain-containing protein [Candidatus Limnocylindrales bacterium]|nr:SH3 domain-containing protein [Candidatus Limnocylindrales bacterium]